MWPLQARSASACWTASPEARIVAFMPPTRLWTEMSALEFREADMARMIAVLPVAAVVTVALARPPVEQRPSEAVSQVV